MLEISAVNVNDAYDSAVDLMAEYGVRSDSRNGPVLAPNFPVVTTYSRPRERVLLNRHRRANPFFHFFECLWMMRGVNDARWLDRFVHDFSSRFAEEDGVMWGAYGHRWRTHFGFDQIDAVCSRLLRDREDRRVVIQMWDAEVDMRSAKHTASGAPARDVPCNTQIYPRIVDEALDFTVTCRSNDVVFGCYGANAVHFSFLQEYVAERVGVRVGRYYQISNNWHLYEGFEDKFKRGEPVWYPGTYPIVQNWQTWDGDLRKFMADPQGASYKNSFFRDVALPMWEAHRFLKQKKMRDAEAWIDRIQAPDWQAAARMFAGIE